MTTNPSPSVVPGTSRSRRHLPWWLILIAGFFLCLLLLPLLVFVVENWAGHRAWTDCQRELEAKGEKLDWSAWVPPTVPDDQNFAATPFFASLRYRSGGPGGNGERWPREYTDAEKEVERIIGRSRRKKGAERSLTDLAAWQQGFHKALGGDSPPDPSADRPKAGAAVLEGLKVCDPILDELREAGRRPQSRFPLHYDQANPSGILLPHLSQMKRAVTVLRVRASAELALGRSDAALEDVKLMLRLADSIKDEPYLISHLVRVACIQITVQTVWEGLAERKWAGAQLPPLQAALARVDILAGAQQALRGERAMGLRCIDYLRTAPLRDLARGNADFDMGGGAIARFRWGLPTGWFLHEKANYAWMLQDLFASDSDIQRHRIEPAALAAKEHRFAAQLGRPWKVLMQHRLFAGLLLPALTSTYSKSAAGQTAVDQAMIACALERYRQANQKFPEKLEGLVPAFIDKLPVDLINGELMGYRQTPEGQFVLWSVGWNESDDGGVLGQAQWDTKGGDWVWEYPAR